MNRDTRLKTTVLILLMLALGAATAHAGASTPRTFDPRYNDGRKVLHIANPSGLIGANAVACKVVGTRLYIAGEFGISGKNPSRIGVTSIGPGDKPVNPKNGYSRARWKLQPAVKRRTLVAHEFAANGYFVYANNASSSSGRRGLLIHRVNRWGNIDKRFGDDGEVQLDWSVISARPGMVIAKSGHIYLFAELNRKITIVRLTRHGVFDKRWGEDGRFELPLEKDVYWYPLSKATSVTSTGGLLIAVPSAKISPYGLPSSKLIMVSPDGRVATSFAGGNSWTPPVPTDRTDYQSFGFINKTKTLANGDIAIAYGDQLPETEGDVLQYRIAVINAKTGETVAKLNDAGREMYLGDGGFPDQIPDRLLERKGGPVRVFSNSFSERYSNGVTSSVGNPFQQLGRTVPWSTGLSLVGDFAASPRRQQVFVCGAEGEVPPKHPSPYSRGLPSHVAIRQLGH